MVNKGGGKPRRRGRRLNCHCERKDAATPGNTCIRIGKQRLKHQEAGVQSQLQDLQKVAPCRIQSYV